MPSRTVRTPRCKPELIPLITHAAAGPSETIDGECLNDGLSSPRCSFLLVPADEKPPGEVQLKSNSSSLSITRVRSYSCRFFGVSKGESNSRVSRSSERRRFSRTERTREDVKQ